MVKYHEEKIFRYEEMKMSAKEMYELCLEQERKYTFPEFSLDDVMELGMTLVEEYSKFPGPLACEIWINGTERFRYYPNGTGEFHERWLRFKRNTVTTMGMASLTIKAKFEMNGSSLEEEKLEPENYALCGGGFPIRIKGGCVIGFIGASGLTDEEDHAAIIAGLESFWNKKGWN